MGMYDITGWSNGTRMPLTYNLRAGQFRGLGKVSIFPGTRTVINNNFGGYDYNMFDYGYQSKTPGWMNWTMGLGLGFNVLGNFFNMFWGGGAGGSRSVAQNEGNGAVDAATATRVAELQNEHKGYSITGPNSKGEFFVRYKKEGKDQNVRCTSLNEVENLLNTLDPIKTADEVLNPNNNESNQPAKVDYSNMSSKNNWDTDITDITAADGTRSTVQISDVVSVTPQQGKDLATDPPEKIIVKIGGKNVELTIVKESENPQKSKNGNYIYKATINGKEEQFELKIVGGKFKLEQTTGMAGSTTAINAPAVDNVQPQGENGSQNANRTQNTQTTISYTIQGNETWYDIAMKYNWGDGVNLYTAIGQLKSENGLTNRRLGIGPKQKANNGSIKIPAGWTPKNAQRAGN